MNNKLKEKFMSNNLGYMEYGFISLNIISRLSSDEAKMKFMYFFGLQRNYRLELCLSFEDLFHYLTESIYLIINNAPRYRGKQIFFTGNAVLARKVDLLKYVEIPIKEHSLINPLIIVPIKNMNDTMNPDYVITTQEDPVFEYLVSK